MSPFDLVALLVLWVVFRLIRGAFSAARRPTSRPAVPEGSATAPGGADEVPPVPPPPVTAARRGRLEQPADPDWDDARDITIPEIGVVAEAVRGSWRDREDASSSSRRRGTRRQSSPRDSAGDLGGLIAQSPLVGGLILREALGPPRSIRPHRPGPRG